jgi:hypothetical protein
MKIIIGVKELRDSGLLGAEYTDQGLYDAFLMYLITKNISVNEQYILHAGDYVLDSKKCFEPSPWLL